ncbi:TOPRIM nucleotidyl transferase/hydrolase domain-containing protein [Naasia aerilata]|nr:TOPRIM nucleotidyl transferase/hydrolase domain-containing protein [Naasia aerilata]
MPARVAVLVEGVSDAEVVRVCAARLGIELGALGVELLPCEGANGMARKVREMQPRPGRLLALCDAHEAPAVRRSLAAAGAPVEPYVCSADLEDELLRALGEVAALEVLAGTGDLRAFRILQGQPQHRARSFEQQLHRFLGAGAGRKARIGAALAAALDPAATPPPIAALLRDAADGR